MKKLILVLLMLFCVGGCQFKAKTVIYNGQIEAQKTKLSSQSNGNIVFFKVNEGDKVAVNQLIAQIDPETLLTQKKQLQEKIEEANLNLESLNAQKQQLLPQMELNQDLLKKTIALVKASAAPSQRQDELAAQVKVLSAQLQVISANIKINFNRIEQAKTAKQLLEIQIKNTIIRAPFSGTILNKYHNVGELVLPGTPLLEMANLDKLEVHIFVPLKELTSIKLGQSVTITADGMPTALTGKVAWIASEAEFTPKTILTKETRATLVYEVMINVANTFGQLKIGMPVEVRL